MSLACKCDRCGKHFDIPKCKVHKIRMWLGDAGYPGLSAKDFVDMDLCDSCNRKLKKWLKNEGEG